MRNRIRPLVLALAAALAAAGAAYADGKGALVEKSVDVPRERQVTVDIPYEKAALTTVESINDPTERDLRDARETDPNDATLILLRFHYKNDDYYKHKVKLRAVLLDAKDGILGEGGRAGTMDPQQTDDTFTFPMKIKTLDWPNAAKLKVIATFVN